MAFRITVSVICGILVSSFLGCSTDDKIPKFPVSGSVTYKGKPLEGAIVSFTPTTAGRPASAVTDSNGKYALSTESNGDGALADIYKVTIAKYDRQPPAQLPTPQEPRDATKDMLDITDEYPAAYDEMDAVEKSAVIAKNLLPPKFSNPRTSTLVAEVKSTNDKNEFNFDLGK